MYHLRFAALFLPLLLAGCSLGAATYDTGSTTESDPLASPPSPLNNQLLPNLEEGGIVSFEDERYGTRHNVTYTVLEGQAIIDGDVIYGPVDLLLNASLPLEEPSANQYARKRRALSSLKAYTWPGGEVRFNYDSTATEVMLSPIVNAAINEWRARAPYLKFSQVSNALGSMTGILTIKAVPCGGCVANIGYYQEFPGTMMNLQQSCNIPGANGRCTVPEAIHEMGHALGKKYLKCIYPKADLILSRPVARTSKGRPRTNRPLQLCQPRPWPELCRDGANCDVLRRQRPCGMLRQPNQL